MALNKIQGHFFLVSPSSSLIKLPVEIPGDIVEHQDLFGGQYLGYVAYKRFFIFQ